MIQKYVLKTGINYFPSFIGADQCLPSKPVKKSNQSLKSNLVFLHCKGNNSYVLSTPLTALWKDKSSVFMASFLRPGHFISSFRRTNPNPIPPRWKEDSILCRASEVSPEANLCLGGSGFTELYPGFSFVQNATFFLFVCVRVCFWFFFPFTTFTLKMESFIAKAPENVAK